MSKRRPRPRGHLVIGKMFSGVYTHYIYAKKIILLNDYGTEYTGHKQSFHTW